MMGHMETVQALCASSRWPLAKQACANATEIFQEHAAALAAHQSEDGRWHQIINNQSTFLESSETAMFLVAMTRGVTGGWLEKAIFGPVIRKVS